jgi:hypothetical protein
LSHIAILGTKRYNDAVAILRKIEGETLGAR